MMKQAVTELRCQRIGCNAIFTEDNNPEDSCRYHEAPMFHDGVKEWSCCKKRSHDFSLFLEIPGCKSGKHTTEKPIPQKMIQSPKLQFSSPAVASETNKLVKDSCPRCKHGFFCSDHGSQAKEVARVESAIDDHISKIIDINEELTCKNYGCGQIFTEKGNHETACNFHPGPPIFHDRLRGWKCCDTHVKNFDDFMAIPACAKGWHCAAAKPSSSCPALVNQ